MTAYCSTSRPFVITGDAQQIGAVLCPQQMDDHCREWRWREYVQHDKERMENVMAEVRKMNAERRAYMTAQQQADLALAEWQSHRRFRA